MATDKDKLNAEWESFEKSIGISSAVSSKWDSPAKRYSSPDRTPSPSPKSSDILHSSTMSKPGNGTNKHISDNNHQRIREISKSPKAAEDDFTGGTFKQKKDAHSKGKKSRSRSSSLSDNTARRRRKKSACSPASSSSESGSPSKRKRHKKRVNSKSPKKAHSRTSSSSSDSPVEKESDKIVSKSTRSSSSSSSSSEPSPKKLKSPKKVSKRNSSNSSRSPSPVRKSDVKVSHSTSVSSRKSAEVKEDSHAIKLNAREHKKSSSSRDKRHRSHSRERKRSRSRERRRRSRSHGGRRRRSRSYDRRSHGHRRKRSGDRDRRRRSYSRDRYHHRDIRKSRDEGRSHEKQKSPSPKISKPEEKPKEPPIAAAIALAKKLEKELPMEPAITLPLPMPSIAGVPAQITPDMAVQMQFAVMHEQVKAATGVALPKYYNPAAINPLKYAEQIQKRKLLWGGKKQPETKAAEVHDPLKNKWEATRFEMDEQGKAAAKFKRLMGIKEEAPVDEAQLTEEEIKKRQELFRNLDQQYEVARQATHTHRGVGLGFSGGSTLIFPHPSAMKPEAPPK